MSTSSELLQELMERQALTAPQLAKNVGVSGQAVRNWINDGVTPKIATALKVGKFFASPELLEAWGYKWMAQSLRENIHLYRTGPR